jgi:hypothetical protein
MKKLFLPLAFVAVIGMQAQTTIVEEKYEKNNEPMHFNFLQNSNKLVIQKGTGPVIAGLPQVRSLIEFTSNAEKRTLVDDVKFMDCYFTESEGGFVGNIFANMGYVNKIQFFSNGKSSKPYDRSSAKHFKYSDNYGFYLSKKNEGLVDRLDEKDISLKRFDTYNLIKKDIKIELPDLNRLVVNKYWGIGYKLNILDSEHFEIITKAIDKEYKSMSFYRTIYNMEGKKINDLKYIIDLKGLYFVNSLTKGGSMKFDSQGNHIFADDLSINNYIIDKNTKNIFIYGLFGKESEEKPAGYYIFKFSENGEKLYESINYINNEDFQSKSYKHALYNKPIIAGNKLLFVTGRVNIMNSKFYNYNYSYIDIDTGKELSSKFITYEMDRYVISDNFFNEYHTSKQLKNKVINTNGYILYDSNPLVKKYIDSVSSKRKIAFNGLISAEGFWLIETDNKEYYKVTYFEHN